MITYRVVRDGGLWRVWVKMDDGTASHLVRAANRRLRFWWTEKAAQKYVDEANAAERKKDAGR
jgi:hypothetical protein